MLSYIKLSLMNPLLIPTYINNTLGPSCIWLLVLALILLMLSLYSLNSVRILWLLIIKLLKEYFVISLELVLWGSLILDHPLVLCLLLDIVMQVMATVGILGAHGKAIISY